MIFGVDVGAGCTKSKAPLKSLEILYASIALLLVSLSKFGISVSNFRNMHCFGATACRKRGKINFREDYCEDE